MTKVYLAGRVNGDKWEVAPAIDGVKYTSSDGNNHSEHNWGYSYYSFNQDFLKESINTEALERIKDCNLLIAYLYDNKSYGSIAEIAYASTIGIPCHVIIRHKPGKENYDMFDAYWFVCHFPNVTVYEIYCDCMAGKTFQKILKQKKCK
jgi:hypothetical protein